MNKVNDRLVSLEKQSLVERLGVFQPKINRYSLGLIDAINGFEFNRIVKAKNYSQATICINTNYQINIEVKLNNITMYNGNASVVILPAILMAENKLIVRFKGEQNVYATISISGGLKSDKFYKKVLCLNSSNPMLIGYTNDNCFQVNDVNLIQNDYINLNQNITNIVNENHNFNINIYQNNEDYQYQIRCVKNGKNISLNVLNNNDIVINDIVCDNTPKNVAIINTSKNSCDFALILLYDDFFDVYYFSNWKVVSSTKIAISNSFDFIGIDGIVNLSSEVNDLLYDMFIAYSGKATYLVKIDTQNLSFNVTQISSNLFNSCYVLGDKIYLLCDTKMGAHFKVCKLNFSNTKITFSNQFASEYIGHDAMFVFDGKLYSVCNNILGVVYEG